jgi:hypothetical protein
MSAKQSFSVTLLRSVPVLIHRAERIVQGGSDISSTDSGRPVVVDDGNKYIYTCKRLRVSQSSARSCSKKKKSRIHQEDIYNSRKDWGQAADRFNGCPNVQLSDNKSNSRQVTTSQTCIC